MRSDAKNFYAATDFVFSSLFWKIENWTLFLSIFHFPKKVLEKKYAKLYNKWGFLLKEKIFDKLCV
jgi:hypothetical protein